MSDPQYWSSMKGAGVFIWLFLFCLFLGLTIFIYLYDRISVWDIWNSPLWLKIKIPLIVIGVIGFLTSIIAFARYEGRLELQKVREYADAQGWTFTPDDPEGLSAQIANIWWDLKYNLYYVRTVETGSRRIYLFDCSYKHKEAAGRSSDARGTACLVQSERFIFTKAPVKIVTRDWTEVMVSDKLDMGDSPFAQKFLVLSKNQAAARKTVTESIQAIMLEHLKKPLHNPVGVFIAPGGAIVLTDRTFDHERLQDIIDLARQIEAAVE
jgi:hypothetical protein